MNFNRCQTCKDWHYDNEDCRPIFMVHLYNEDGELSEGIKVHAVTHSHAARCFGVQFCYDNKHELLRRHIILDVFDLQGKMERYKVRAEPTIEYYTEKIQLSEANL